MVFAGRQFEDDLRLAKAEMAVVIRRRDRKIDRRQLRVHDQMVVTRPFPFDTRWRNAHLAQPKTHGHGRGHGLSRSGRNEIDLGRSGPLASRKNRIRQRHTGGERRDGQGRSDRKQERVGVATSHDSLGPRGLCWPSQKRIAMRKDRASDDSILPRSQSEYTRQESAPPRSAFLSRSYFSCSSSRRRTHPGFPNTVRIDTKACPAATAALAMGRSHPAMIASSCRTSTQYGRTKIDITRAPGIPNSAYTRRTNPSREQISVWPAISETGRNSSTIA